MLTFFECTRNIAFRFIEADASIWIWNPLKKMMMAAYSDDVFTNFYPWLREHEELLTQYSE